MTVSFRNVDVPVDEPICRWPYEALVTVIERGTLADWVLITREIRRDPWGVVARQVEDFLAYRRPWGVAPLLERSIAGARQRRELSERLVVTCEVTHLIERSGLSMGDFARRIGTSRSRLSTYRSGKVVPSAILMVRMGRLVHDLETATSD